MKRFILFSLLIHAMPLLVLAGSFRGSPSLPAMIEVDIVMSGEAAPAEKKGAGEQQAEKHAAPAQKMAEVAVPIKAAKVQAKRPIAAQEKEVEELPALTEEREKSEKAAPVPSSHVRRTVAASLRDGFSTGSTSYRATAASYSPGPFTDGGKDAVQAGVKRQFQSMVLRKIEAAKRYPARARHRGIEGDAVVHFTIAPNGMVERVRVTSDSRCHTWLKEAAIKTVRRGAPYLPLPPAFNSAEGVEMSVRISFNLS